MTTTTIQTATTISEPAILSANTYFWTPSSVASGRRNNEERNQAAVAAYFTALGLSVTRSGDAVLAEGAGLEIAFSYSETCGNVYKSLSVTREGKKSNITAIRKLAAKVAA